MVRVMTCPEAVFWDPSFEVGDAVIDGQHRHIVELINALHTSADGDGASTADVLLDHIGRFLQNHFETEEVLLQKFAYGDLERHTAEHHRLLARIGQTADLIRNGRETNERLATIIWSWLHDHTATWDQEYASALHTRR